MDFAQKQDDLIKWFAQASEDHVPEDVLNNCRKAGEAFCKLIIINRFGETEGNKIIKGETQPNGTVLTNAKSLDFSALIATICQESRDKVIIINDKTLRGKIKSWMEVLRSHGNSASHDTNHSTHASTLTDSNFALKALSLAIEWLYNSHLKSEIPESINLYLIPDSSSLLDNVDKFSSSRGADIIKVRYPNLIANSEYVSKSQEDIGYEFVFVEVAKQTRLGYIFLKKSISITRTYEHFLKNHIPDLVALVICEPRTTNHISSGKSVARLSYIKDKFIELAPNELSTKTEFFYTDEFVWQQCLPQEFHTQILSPAPDKNFVDQELFSISAVENATGILSQDYVRQVMGLNEKRHPLTVIIGRAGVGKTTFCESAVRLINGYDRKRALLISSTDLRDAARICDAPVRSVKDLYSLFLKCTNPIQFLEPASLEINVACGNFVLVIDGLDEIESILKENFDMSSFIQSVSDLNESYLNSTIMVTSRDYYADKYKSSASVEMYHLRGFSESMVIRYLKNRLTDHVDSALKYLNKFDMKDQNRHTPLYLSLICDLIERENDDQIALPDIKSSKYFYSENRLDNLIFQLITREIGKQSLAISCDDYFEILKEIVMQPMGVSLASLNEIIELLGVERTSVEQSEAFSQIYVSPLIARSQTINKNSVIQDRFEIKYDFINLWVRARFFVTAYRSCSREQHFQDLLEEIHDGKSPLLQELTYVNPIWLPDYKELAHLHLKNLLNQYSSEVNRKSERSLRWRISGLLYFMFTIAQPKNKQDASSVISEVYKDNHWKYFSIFGKYYQLDFKDVQVWEGWFENYSNLINCDFPDSDTVFFYSTFKTCGNALRRTSNTHLFDNTCNLDEELSQAFAAEIGSVSDIFVRVRQNVYRIVKVGYNSGNFQWKSESIYKNVAIAGGVTLNKYLDFLTANGVLEKSHKVPSTNNREFGYLVSNKFSRSAKKLIADSLLTPEFEDVVREAMRVFHNV